MPSNPSGRPVINTVQRRSAPRTLPVDDFIQISDAARAHMGTEVMTDLQGFLDASGHTSTSGSFRVTTGSAEIASIPRRSVSGQANIYIGTTGDTFVDRMMPGSIKGLAVHDVGSAKGLNETPGLTPKTSGSFDLLIKSDPDEVVAGKYRFNRSATIISHEIGHAIDFAAESVTGSGITGHFTNDISTDISNNIEELKRLIDSGMNQEEALDQSGVKKSIFSQARGYGESEALADTSSVSSYRRLAENNPELARRMGLDDAGDFTMFGETRQRTLSLDIVDRFSGNRMALGEAATAEDKVMKIASGYTLGRFDDSMTQGKVDMASELRYAGVSDDLIEELTEQTKAVTAATYAARVGGFEEGSEELDILGRSARARGKTTISAANYDEQIKLAQQELASAESDLQRMGDYAGEKSRKRVERAREKVERLETLRQRNLELYDEVFEQETVKGRYNINVVDDVSEAAGELQSGRPTLSAKAKQGPRAMIDARVSQVPTGKPVLERAPTVSRATRRGVSRATRRGVADVASASAAVASGVKGSNNLRAAGASALLGIARYGMGMLR